MRTLAVWRWLYPSMVIGGTVCGVLFWGAGQLLFPNAPLLAEYYDIIVGSLCGILLAYMLAPMKAIHEEMNSL